MWNAEMETIAFDASCTAKRERTGVGRYAACLLDALFQRAGEQRYTLGYRLSRWRRASYRYRTKNPRVRERWFIDHLAQAMLGPHDLFHGLDARLPRGWSGPMVATLHDVGAIEHEAIASSSFRDKKLAAYADLAERATQILCVSSATRDAFRTLFPVPVERFTIVHHGLEARFRPPKADELARLITKHRLPARFLLFVGLISTRKNLAVAIEAFTRVAAEDASLHLVLAGGHSHGFDVVGDAIAGSPARDRIRLLGYVDDAELPALYGAARAFVFPGLAEGFGMPLLEAMACGTPVLAADRPVTIEVAGDAALVADAADPLALAAAMARIVQDDAVRARLTRLGAERAAGFTWANAAEETLGVYRAALERRQLA